jgi:hypothetical protein
LPASGVHEHVVGDDESGQRVGLVLARLPGDSGLFEGREMPR